jgi:hypothetical protein
MTILALYRIDDTIMKETADSWLRGKPDPVQLCPSRLLLDVAWERAGATEVGSYGTASIGNH